MVGTYRRLLGFVSFDTSIHFRMLIVNKGPLFLKRFRDVCIMRKKHADAFKVFSSTFKAEMIVKWSKMVNVWLCDRTKPNPYKEAESSKSSRHFLMFMYLNVTSNHFARCTS